MEISISYKKGDTYELKYNLYDPTQSSPPNDFMRKLYLRMEAHQKDQCATPSYPIKLFGSSASTDVTPGKAVTFARK